MLTWLSSSPHFHDIDKEGIVIYLNTSDWLKYES